MYWKAVVSKRFPPGTNVEFTSNHGKIRLGEVVEYVSMLKLRVKPDEGEFVVSHKKVKKPK